MTFENGDGTTTFVNPPATNYNFTDGTDTMIFRTAFAEADYIGSLVPSGPTGFLHWLETLMVPLK
ncbi:hypothetical protein H9X57_12545 [Flavobacterium piscinae]|nr:hypothetical protein [Flavobacterium piscinae]